MKNLNFIFWDEVNGTSDQPLLAGFIILFGSLIEVRNLSSNLESLVFMDHYNALDISFNFFTRLQEKFGFPSPDLLPTVLRLAGLINWVFNYAVLILGEYDNFLLTDQLFVSIDYMNILSFVIN